MIIICQTEGTRITAGCGSVRTGKVPALPEVLPLRFYYAQFTLFLAGRKNDPEPFSVLENLRKAVDTYPFRYQDISLHITVTIGAAWFTPGQSIDEWINEADRRLYAGKAGGKNRVVAR